MLAIPPEPSAQAPPAGPAGGPALSALTGQPHPAPAQAQDAVLGLLLPFWQLVIAGFVLVALVVSVRRLAGRGPSRMTTGLLVTGAAIIGLAVLGILLQ